MAPAVAATQRLHETNQALVRPVSVRVFVYFRSRLNTQLTD